MKRLALVLALFALASPCVSPQSALASSKYDGKYEHVEKHKHKYKHKHKHKHKHGHKHGHEHHDGHMSGAHMTTPSLAVPGVSKELGGALLGAAVGGLVGSQVGKGSGRLVAVGAGVLLGGLLGSEVGRSLDRADQLHAERAAQNSLENAPLGRTLSWNNPDSGHSGTVTPIKTYQTGEGRYCREYQQTLTVGGQTEQAYGTACRQPDGGWELVK